MALSGMIKKRILWTGFRVFIAFGILYYLFRKVPISHVISTLTNANSNYLFSSLLITILMSLFVSYRLKFLAENQGIQVTTLQAFEINVAALFYRLFLPGGNLAAGVIRFYKLSLPNRKMTEALAALAFDRIISAIALCIVGISFWFIHFPSNSGYIALGMSFVLIGLILLIFAMFFDRNSILLKKLSELFDLTLFSSGISRLVTIINRFRRLSSISIAFILTLSLTSQVLGVVVYYLLALALNIEISFLAMGWIRCAVVLITMIPISISGLGVREGSLLLLLKPYGIENDEAVAFSFLIFIITVVMIGVIGGMLEGLRFLLKDVSVSHKLF
jgi:glycosyltransferase 2 family protein